MTNEEKQTCAERELECNVASYSYNERLKLFVLTNLITVIVPSLLAVVAGSAFFASGDEWKLFVGVSVLVAALLTAIHKGFDCDAYQAESRRLIRAYDGMAVRYRTLSELSSQSGAKDLLELEKQLAELHESVMAKLPPGYQAKIKQNYFSAELTTGITE